MFRFRKTDTEVTGEMLFSKDKDTILQGISAGVLPEILQRDDAGPEVVKRREQGSSLYLDKTGKVVSCAEMKAQGGLETALKVTLSLDGAVIFSFDLCMLSKSTR